MSGEKTFKNKIMFKMVREIELTRIATLKTSHLRAWHNGHWDASCCCHVVVVVQCQRLRKPDWLSWTQADAELNRVILEYCQYMRQRLKDFFRFFSRGPVWMWERILYIVCRFKLFFWLILIELTKSSLMFFQRFQTESR